MAIIGMAIAQSSDSEGSSTMSILRQDSGTNLSQMNFSLYTAVDDWGINGYSVGEAVKFTAPRDGWKLKQIQVVGHNGYNGTAVPIPENFLIEVRDSKLNLLYQYADTQNAFFTYKSPILRSIDVPALAVSSDFYIIFYDRGTMQIGMETENGTGYSYLYNSLYTEMIPAEFKIENNEPVKVNWLIRAVGE